MGSATQERMAVVGAGPLGLMTLKELQEQDFSDVTGKYRLQCRVRRIVREKGRWALELEDAKTGQGEIRSEYFDRVCVATGSYQKPRWPVFSGLEKFTGTVLHSIEFHDAAAFRGQNVLLVGIHATARDVTVALVAHAKQVYLSHRHGLLMVPRFTPEGEPLDSTLKLPFVMIQWWLMEHIPSLWVFILNRALTSMSEKAYPNLPESWGMRPAQSLAVSTPLAADQLWPHLESGFAEPVAAIEEVPGPKSVRLASGRVLVDIDAIIHCTGYHSVLSDGLIPKPAPGHADTVEASYDPYPDAVAGTAIFPTFGGYFRGLFNPRAWGLWRRDRALYRLCTEGLPSPTLFRIFETGRRKALGEAAGRAVLKLDNDIYERAVLLKRRELGLDAQGKPKSV